MDSSSSPTTTATTTSTETYEVESIDGKYFAFGQILYNIKWKNYTKEENTWEPIIYLSCQETIDEYERKNAGQDDSLDWIPNPVKILKHQVIDDKTEYFVKWENGAPNSWVEHDCGPMKKLIAQYNQEMEKKKQSKPSSKRKLSSNENDHKKMHQPKITKLLVTDEIDEIYDMKRTPEGIKFLVLYKNSFDFEYVAANILKRNFPQKVIQFYERCIKWE